MPRLPRSLILRAYRISPLLPIVLQGTRTLPSAINELRWLREYVEETSKIKAWNESQKRWKLLQYCYRRSRAEPLQYLLGSQPFGELEIKCRRGVLIPRPETEAYTTHFAKLLSHPELLEMLKLAQEDDDGVSKQNPRSLVVVDACSGSGCISLLLQSLLAPHYKRLRITGLDISTKALRLSRENLRLNHFKGYLKLTDENEPLSHQVQFKLADIFEDPERCAADAIISNPPYISEKGFNKETTRSVRNWEPKLALVPQKEEILLDGDHFEDKFYRRLLDLYQLWRSKFLLMEVGDAPQAWRVVEIATKLICPRTYRIEIWRDRPDLPGLQEEWNVPFLERAGYNHDVRAIGTGNIRAVFIGRRTWKEGKRTWDPPSSDAL